MRSLLTIAFALVACRADKPIAIPKTTGPSADVERVARACALVTSCADAHDATHLRDPSRCVDWWLVSTRVEEEDIACLSAAKGCADVERCTHDPVDRAAVDYCVAHPGVLGVCEGSRLYSCSDEAGESSAVDCASLGGACVEQRVAGGLVVRGCASPKLCPQGAPPARCEGDAIVRCEDGIAERRACPKSTRCAPSSEDGARCEGEPLADRPRRCSKPGLATCDGDRVTFCTLVGGSAWLRTTDCAATWGMTCRARDGRANCASRGGCASEPRCDGDELVFCAAGAEARVSCKELGFSRCDDSARGQEPGCR